MQTKTALLASLFACATLSAQSYVYLPSDTPSTGGDNIVPFGTVKSDVQWVNQRYQTLIPASALGRSGLQIRSLAFAATKDHDRSHDDLQVTIAQTKKTQLDLVFANNLSVRPLVVLKAKSHVWKPRGNKWTNIGLQKTYRFDPADGNLVIEVCVLGNDRLDAKDRAGFHTYAGERNYRVSFTGPCPPTASGRDAFALKMRLEVSNEDVTLTTQAQVDAFNLTRVAGTLVIGPSSGATAIKNLRALRSLTRVTKSLTIHNNAALADLDGLDSLSEVASLAVYGNTLLANIDGLNGLTRNASALFIYSNPALTNVDGLSSLTEVPGPWLNIIDNAKLENLNGLRGLRRVAATTQITYGRSLTSFCGLYPLLSGTGMTGKLVIHNNKVNPTAASIVANGPCGGTYTLFGTACEGSGSRKPAHGHVGGPVIGKSFSIDLSQAKPSTIALLFLGRRVNVPIRLAPTCSIYAFPDFLLTAKLTDSKGEASTTVAVPNDSSLRGVRITTQWYIHDAVNALQFVFSNGGEGTIGD